MAPHVCEYCANPMPLLARRSAKTCSPRCRTATSRARALPAAMTRLTRWVRYDANKVPLMTSGKCASSTAATTWTTYAKARSSKAGIGVGFVLASDGIVCLDLDHCISAGVLAGWARAILDRCPPTYIEVSASGTGLHVFGLGTVRAGRKIRGADGSAVEVYGSGRYIAMTGNRFENAPSNLGSLANVLDAIAPRSVCPHCGDPLTNARRVQCGKDECKRAWQRERMRRFFAEYRQQHGRAYTNRYREQRAEIARRYRARIPHWRERHPLMALAAEQRRERRKRTNGPVEAFAHREIFERDNWRCGVCRKRIQQRLSYPHPLSASLDHIVPLAEGGAHTRANVRAAHLRCNLSRGARGGGEQLALC